MTSSLHVYEIRPRKDRRGFDLIGDRLPLGILWFEGPGAIGDAVSYAKFFSRSQPAIIRLFDESGAVIEGRASFRSGEIRVLDSSGIVERIIPFSEADRML